MTVFGRTATQTVLAEAVFKALMTVVGVGEAEAVEAAVEIVTTDIPVDFKSESSLVLATVSQY